MNFNVMPTYTNRAVVDSETNKKIKSLSRENAVVVELIEELEIKVDRLTLVTQALWELLQTKAGLAESDLTALIEEIDLRDGVKDGKHTSKPKNCVKCNRVVSVRTNMCLYCGYKVRQ